MSSHCKVFIVAHNRTIDCEVDIIIERMVNDKSDTYLKMFRFVVAVIPDPQSIGHHSQLEAVHVEIPRAIGACVNDTWIWLMVGTLH